MPEERIALTKVFDGWGAYQEKIAGAVTPLAPEQLALRVAPQLRSIHWRDRYAHHRGARSLVYQRLAR